MECPRFGVRASPLEMGDRPILADGVGESQLVGERQYKSAREAEQTHQWRGQDDLCEGISPAASFAPSRQACIMTELLGTERHDQTVFKRPGVAAGRASFDGAQ